MKHNALYHIILTSLFAAVLFSTQPVFGQHCKFYEITYKDSLVSEKTSNLLINNIKIYNSRNKTTRMAIRIEVPNGWKNVATNKRIEGDEIFYNLSPGQSKNIPLNLIKLPKASTQWDSVKITVRLTELADTHTHYYLIMAAPHARFEGEHLTDDIFLMQRPEGEIPLKVSLRNTGNIEDEYTIRYESYRSNIHHSSVIKLKPGQDTIYTYRYKLPVFSWADFHKESIALNITSKQSEDGYSHSFNISKSRRIIKKQRYPYNSFPLTLETGALNYGKIYTYYVGVSGAIDFGKENNLLFNYRSRQIGREVYGLQRDMFTVTYNYRKWSASAGQISSPQQFFMSNGRGGSLTYKPKENTEYTVAVNLKDSNFFYNSNTFALSASYMAGKMPVRQVLVADFNDQTAVDGVVLFNTAEIKSTGKLTLSVNGGAGVENRRRDIPGLKKQAIGVIGGYSLNYKLNSWALSSSATYFSRDVPGTQKGMALQLHQITKTFKGGVFFGFNYSLNHIETRYFIDTLYNTDVLKNNSVRYGVTTGINKADQRLTVNFGYLKNSQVDAAPSTTPYFADINYSWIINASSYLGVGVQNAFSKSTASENETMHTTTLSGAVKFGFIGVSGSYTRFPSTDRDRIQGGNKYQTTVSGGPFINFTLFNRKLSGSLRYNISKSLYDTIPRQMANGSLSYTAAKQGISITAAGNLPLNSATINGVRLPISESKNFTISLIKHLNIPIPAKRKYVSMRSIAYHDLNNNGKRDAGETGLQNVKLEISEMDTTTRPADDDTDPIKYTDELYTNKKGEVKYLNANKGVYYISMGDAEVEGLVPARASSEKITLTKNMEIAIPYKKARLIKGTVTIISDSFFSAVKLTPDYIKIICVENSGKKYVTLTDKKGDFFFNLPAGKYTVSLNPMAFKSTDFKPDQLEYEVDLLNSEEEKVQFIIRQKKRKIRFMDTKDGATESSKNTSAGGSTDSSKEN